MGKNNNIIIKNGNWEKFRTPWFTKEGVFETPNSKFIVRVRVKGVSNPKTLAQFDTKEEADLVYNEYLKKKL